MKYLTKDKYTTATTTFSATNTYSMRDFAAFWVEHSKEADLFVHIISFKSVETKYGETVIANCIALKGTRKREISIWTNKKLATITEQLSPGIAYVITSVFDSGKTYKGNTVWTFDGTFYNVEEGRVVNGGTSEERMEYDIDILEHQADEYEPLSYIIGE